VRADNANPTSVRSLLAATRSERGLSLLELLVVLAVAAATSIAAMPFLVGYWHGHQLRSAAERTESLVRRVRMSALKEKNAYRVVLHDENAATPNRVEIQRDDAGSWTTLDGGVVDLGGGVRILGGGGSDSADAIVVGPRGECQAGEVYFQGTEADTVVVSVAPSCLTSRS
jgi:prepilin-type N-terminal cleavage/methylation domain-containing protein